MMKPQFIFLVTISIYSVQCNILQKVIAKQDECIKDIPILQNMCEIHDADIEDNWVLLDCIDKIPPEKKISEPCENLVWQFKFEITRTDHFREEAQKVCGDEDFCAHEADSEPGHMLSCLVGKRHETKSIQCSQFLTQVGNLIFSDYRIISSFLKECDDDVLKLTCGKTRITGNGAKHSQGATIDCLERQIDSVSDKCKAEIYKIAEIQADDFHLDRALFLACRHDKEQFCGRVQSGEGRVYRCLMKYKSLVSETCQLQLTRRQQLISQDFKADGGLIRSCKKEIKEYSCKKVIDKDSNNGVKLSQVLLCLEESIRDGHDVSGQCLNEMREIRREMMEDFNISPELVANCGTEIDEHCADTKKKMKGQTIHCLMKLATDESDHKKIGDKCEAALDDLLRQTQIMTDWRADPVLEDACDEVVAASCHASDNDNVMACLMEQLSKNSPAMTSTCSEVLMQIHYFLAREIIIDTHLYQACYNDAIKMCNGAPNWKQTKDNPKNLLVFPCLVRNLYNDEDEFDNQRTDDKEEFNEYKLSDACVGEVERTLRQRAMSVNLHPDIEEDCRDFLHTKCLSHVNPGEELGCLQENFADLNPECKATVEEYTKIEAKNPYLHPVISKACFNVIDRKCGLEAKAGDGQGVMECLVRHKMEHPAGAPKAMNKKCRVVVEQWQILTMQDWKFSFEFKEACKNDIQNHCNNPKPKKKQEVIQCLVEAVASDTVDELKHRISRECRDKLKFESLQKHSNIKLDPVLGKACQEDLEKFCASDRNEDGGIECLKSQKQRLLTKECKKQLFKEEQEEAVDNEVDFALARGCKREIKEHCAGEDGSNILKCLKDFSNDVNFDQTCLDILHKRIAQQSHDYRLNPSLKKSCNKDIKKFCNNIISQFNEEEGSLEGQVINCLKESALQKQKLSEKCMKEVVLTMVDAAKMVDADPVLAKLCPTSLVNCRSVYQTDQGIHKCLKDLFQRGGLVDGTACEKHVAEMIEAVGADIHTDPVLNNACAVDLRKFCRDITPGDGRMFACLVKVSKEKSFTLEQECQSVLNTRVEMFGMAVKIAPLESAKALYESVMKSPHRNYLLSFLSFFIGVIFFFGICFGRVTKRLRTELKNK